jgi:hypothetical protein
MQEQPKDDLHQYRTFNLPLLYFMGLLAIVGIVATLILQ